MAATGDESEPIEALRWRVAERFGWTLDYIDSLSVADLHEYLQIQDGLGHAQKSIIKR